jgi:heme-degrading monooxygenase HmoA
VIARVWSAQTRRDQVPAYADHLREHVLPLLGGVEGYLGARLWQREVDENVEIVVVTQWSSLDAIQGFAGDEIELAVVAGEAAALLSSFDDRVRHYELVIEDNA